jgi:prepilin-type N-terminal cleavage/methylation domain-containing protein
MIDPNSATNRERGFSLAEVLVAVALLAVILLALFGLVTSGVRGADAGKKMTEASVLAQHVMERVNVYDPQKLLGLSQADTCTADGGPDAYVSTTTSVVKTWTRGATTTPAAEGTSDTNAIERNEIRNLLATADLPADAAHPATLTITATPMPQSPTASSFANASMVRIVVDLDWTEWGTRHRTVRLQAFNLRTQP